MLHYASGKKNGCPWYRAFWRRKARLSQQVRVSLGAGKCIGTNVNTGVTSTISIMS
jgi:hypothetical protein